MLPHARRLKHNRVKLAIDWSGIDLRDLSLFTYLYRESDINTEAEDMYLRALKEYEKALYPEDTSTLDIVNNLDNLYNNQSKITKVEKIYERALKEYEKV